MSDDTSNSNGWNISVSSEPDTDMGYDQSLVIAERLRRRRTRRWLLIAAASVVAVIAVVVTLLIIGGSGQLPADTWTPQSVDAQHDDELPAETETGTETGTEDAEGSSGGFNIRLDTESGQIVADIEITGTVDSDNENPFTEASSITGGTSHRVDPGLCGFRTACPNGLPHHFIDDLNGLIEVDELPVLPVDDPFWFRARTECYQSPRSVADCNLELARGGYGLMQQAGLDNTCIVEVYKHRVGYDSVEPPRWWDCAAAWWTPPGSSEVRQETGDVGVGNNERSLCSAYSAYMASSSSSDSGDAAKECDDALKQANINLAANSVLYDSVVCETARTVLGLVDDSDRQVMSCDQWTLPPINLKDLESVLEMQEQSQDIP